MYYCDVLYCHVVLSPVIFSTQKLIVAIKRAQNDITKLYLDNTVLVESNSRLDYCSGKL